MALGPNMSNHEGGKGWLAAFTNVEQATRPALPQRLPGGLLFH
jgi:hypothetical protein